MVLKNLIGPLAVAAILGALPLAWVYGIEAGVKEAAAKPSAQGSAALQARFQPASLPGGAGFEARRPLSPMTAAYINEYGADSESLIVKFADDVEARVENGRLVSRRNVNVQSARQISTQHGLTPSPFFSLPESQLQTIRSRVASQSGRAQPDFAGFVRFRGERGKVLAAAHAMQALDIVEFVDFEENYEAAPMPHYREMIREPGQAAPEPEPPLLADAAPGMVDEEDYRKIKPWLERRADREADRKDAVTELREQGHSIAPRRPILPKIPQREIPVHIDSGVHVDSRAHDDPNRGLQTIWSEVVGEQDAPWVRLRFGQVELGGDSRAGTGSIIVVRSLADLDEQVFTIDEIARWNHFTGRFTGSHLLVQLKAYPDSGPNRVEISEVIAGEWVGGIPLNHGEGGVADPCGGTDERVLTCSGPGSCIAVGGVPCTPSPTGSALATARLVPAGCTGFLFDGNSNCMLTAGHCAPSLIGQGAMAEFNVPCSAADGTPMPPPLADQYPVEDDSWIYKFVPCDADSCAQDWAYFRVDDNNLGQDPLARQGGGLDISLQLATGPMLIGGDMVERLGHGETGSTPLPLGLNLVLKHHLAPVVAQSPTAVFYHADSSGGDSGGPVIHEDSGLVVAIHTCGGCASPGGANMGTAIWHPELRAAMTGNPGCAADQGGVGACCIPGVGPGPGFGPGACFDSMTAGDCGGAGGTFMGLNTTCDPLWGCRNDLLCCWDPARFGFPLPSPMCGAPPNILGPNDKFTCDIWCGDILGIYVPDEFECPEEIDDESPCNEEPSCGSPTAGECWEPGGPYCNQEACCECVGEIASHCADDDGAWNEICIMIAQTACAGVCSMPPPICPGFGDCFVDNGTPGCTNPGCCFAVCSNPTFALCCDPLFGWTDACAARALEVCVNLDPSVTPTPDLRAAQGYLTTPGWIAEHGFVPSIVASAIPGPLWIGNRPFSGWGGEGYDLANLFQLGQNILDEYGMGQDPDNPGQNLTRGAGIQIAVLFPTAFVHETNDPLNGTTSLLSHEALRNRVTYAEPDQTQLLLPNSATGLLDGHVGTAVLGILGAEETTAPGPQVGMVGIVPEADLRFYATVSVEEGGRYHNAFASALLDMNPGDVIVVPYKPRAVTVTFASFPTGWLLLNTATFFGVHTVIAAGDECLPIAGQFDGEDSGVTIIGAVTPGLPYYRGGHAWGTDGGIFQAFGPAMSNYCSGTPCEMGETVHTASWGGVVAAPGFGNLFAGNPQPGASTFERSYTNSFGGTPAAAALVGGITAALSGLTKQAYGVPLTPEQVRGEISITGFPQAGIGFFADPNCYGSSPAGNCFGDWDIEEECKRVASCIVPDPLSGENLVNGAVFTDLWEAGEWLLISGFFDQCDELEEVHTIRGTHLFGILKSICAVDNNFYIVRSQGTNASSKPSHKPPGFESPLNKVSYRATGQIADVFTVGSVEDPDVVVGFGIRMVAAGTTVPTIQHIEIYDWHAERWQWGATAYVPAGPNDMTTSPVATFNPHRFFNENGQFLVRTWAYGFSTGPNPGGGFGPGSGDAFDFRLDLVEVNVVNLGDVPGD